MTNLRLIAIAAAGLAVGGVIGYKYAEKKLLTEFEERLDRETNILRRIYKPDHDTPEQMVEALHGEAVANVMADPTIASAVKAMAEYQNPEQVAYHKIRVSGVEVTKVDETPLVTRKIFEPADDRGEIYIISAEEHEQAEAGYEEVTWTYYAKDNVVTDDAEDRIEDHEKYLGTEALQNFGGISGDDNVVYVRNEILMIDYEIVRDPRAYVEAVLGEEYRKIERPSQRMSPGD